MFSGIELKLNETTDRVRLPLSTAIRIEQAKVSSLNKTEKRRYVTSFPLLDAYNY